MPIVRGQPAHVAGLGEPHGSEIFLSGCLAFGISKKRPPLEGSKDDLGLSLGHGRIKGLWAPSVILLFLMIVSRAKSPSAQRALESKVLMFFYLPSVRDHRHRTAGATSAGSIATKHSASQRVGVRLISLFGYSSPAEM